MARWFRFYDDALNDPKVQCLSPHLFRVWVNLLCVASKNDGALPDAAALAFLLRQSEDDTKRDLSDLKAATLLDASKNGFTPHNWSERQYKSDVSTERSKQHRQRHRNVAATAAQQPSNAPATPSETEQSQIQTRPETEIKSKPIASRAPDVGELPEFLRRAPPVQTRIVAGGFKQIGAGKRIKNPRRADEVMEAYLYSRCGMTPQEARDTVSSARTPAAEGHVEAYRFCEKISRENKLGWFHAEAAE